MAVTTPTCKPYRVLLGVVVAALLVRIYASWVLLCVSKDAIWFVTCAQAIADGDYGIWLGHNQHPLTALVVWLGGMVTGDWITGGRFMNVIVGALTLLPAYGIARQLFGHRAALCVAWLMAFHVHAARYSADVLSEPLYLFFFLWAIYFGLRGVLERGKGPLALCGLASGLAYLTRPEGLGVVLVAGAWVCLSRIREVRQDWRPRAGRLVALGLASVVVAGPYMLYVGGVSRKKRPTELIKFRGPGAATGVISVPGEMQADLLVKGTAEVEASRLRGVRLYVASAYALLSKLVSALTHVLVPFVLVGMLARRGQRRSGKGELYMASMVLLYLVLLYAVRTSAGYLGRRHAFPVAMVLLMWAGPGTLALAQWLGRLPWLVGRAGLARWIPLLVLTVVLGFRAGEPRGTDKRGEAMAGRWIQRHCATRPKTISLEMPRAACYANSDNYEIIWAFCEHNAEGKWVKNLDRVQYWAILEYACRIGATHVVVDENRIYDLVPRFVPDAAGATERGAVPRLELAKRFKRSWRDAAPSILIYQVIPGPEGGSRVE